jgi:hypothetical protein
MKGKRSSRGCCMDMDMDIYTSERLCFDRQVD